MATNPRLWSIQCLIDWLQIREQEGHSFPANLSEFIAEVDHSALFRRLIEGKAALPNPPPLSYANPWYELEENGVAYPDPPFEIVGKDLIVINNHAWDIIQKTSADDYIVTQGGGVQFHLWSSFASDEDGASFKVWKIERL